MRWMVFDVESVGLHGEGFAVGWVLIDERGIELSYGQLGCSPDIAFPQDRESREWVQENCEWVNNCASPRALRDRFWYLYEKQFFGIPGRKTVLAAECPWPVEARFLQQIVFDDPSRIKNMPYPLIDIASVRLAAGLDPVGSERRYQNELPAHNAMADARQSARLLLEALRITGRQVVIGS